MTSLIVQYRQQIFDRLARMNTFSRRAMILAMLPVSMLLIDQHQMLMSWPSALLPNGSEYNWISYLFYGILICSMGLVAYFLLANHVQMWWLEQQLQSCYNTLQTKAGQLERDESFQNRVLSNVLTFYYDAVSVYGSNVADENEIVFLKVLKLCEILSEIIGTKAEIKLSRIVQLMTGSLSESRIRRDAVRLAKQPPSNEKDCLLAIEQTNRHFTLLDTNAHLQQLLTRGEPIGQRLMFSWLHLAETVYNNAVDTGLTMSQLKELYANIKCVDMWQSRQLYS